MVAVDGLVEGGAAVTAEMRVSDTQQHERKARRIASHLLFLAERLALDETSNRQTSIFPKRADTCRGVFWLIKEQKALLNPEH